MADPTNALGLDPQTMALFAPPQQSGLAKFFGNPVTQAALATYFGAISSPRERGVGGAIGQGGLAGLGAYQQAAQMQANLPLMRAKQIEAMASTGGNIAKAGEERAHGQVYQHQAAAYNPNPNEAMQWEHLKKDPRFTDPISQQVLSELSAGAQNGTMTLQGRMNAFTALNQGNQKAALDAINIEKAKADIQLTGQKAITEAMRPGEIRAHESAMATEAGSAATRANIAASLAPSEQRKNVAQATLAEVNAAPLAQEQKAMGKVNTDLGRFATTRPVHFYTNTDAWVKDATDYAATQNPTVPRDAIEKTAQSLAGASGATAAPEGATHEIIGPDGTVAGHVGADGKPTWLPGKEPKESAER